MYCIESWHEPCLGGYIHVVNPLLALSLLGGRFNLATDVRLRTEGTDRTDRIDRFLWDLKRHVVPQRRTTIKWLKSQHLLESSRIVISCFPIFLILFGGLLWLLSMAESELSRFRKLQDAGRRRCLSRPFRPGISLINSWEVMAIMG